jgi:hypothetical protein
VALVSVVVVLLSSAVLISRSPAFAQEATPTAMAAVTAHPVVGAWRWTIDVGGVATVPALATFHADGTYTQLNPDQSGLIGVWRSTGERTADLTLYSLYLVDDKLVNGEVRLTVEVDETGTTMISTGTFVGLFEDGSIDIAVEAPATVSRLDILPVVPLGTPVLPGMVEAGTPTP